MHLTECAEKYPTKVAVLMADSGDALTYRELDATSRNLSATFRNMGLVAGDTVAILMENCPEYFIASLAAQRTGLYFVPVNWHLTEREARYIISNSQASAVITTEKFGALATAASAGLPKDRRIVLGGNVNEFTPVPLNFNEPPPLQAEPDGYYMFYSSGTTGQPKGIKRPLSGAAFGSGLAIEHRLNRFFGFDESARYLSTGPLYHAAPLGWALGTIALGGTVIVMPRFEPDAALAAIVRYSASHAQFVPTMLVRILKLPSDLRSQYDLSSLRAVVHAAAPCPEWVKDEMIRWLGPIVYEFYSGSEGVCFFLIDSADWLTHRGSVGRAIEGVPHILDSEGAEMPTGEVGQIWVEPAAQFEYYNDPAKTAAAFNSRGWATLGDMGRLDSEGYLYLADRRTDLVISGGVNIYPREIEDVLVMHPDVTDTAVIGLSDDEMGQIVSAVIQLRPGVPADETTRAAIYSFLEDRIARYKLPRRIDFLTDLPRLPSGKVRRWELRDRLQAELSTDVA